MLSIKQGLVDGILGPVKVKCGNTEEELRIQSLHYLFHDPELSMARNSYVLVLLRRGQAS